MIVVGQVFNRLKTCRSILSQVQNLLHDKFRPTPYEIPDLVYCVILSAALPSARRAFVDRIEPMAQPCNGCPAMGRRGVGGG